MPLPKFEVPTEFNRLISLIKLSKSGLDNFYIVEEMVDDYEKLKGEGKTTEAIVKLREALEYCEKYKTICDKVSEAVGVTDEWLVSRNLLVKTRARRLGEVEMTEVNNKIREGLKQKINSGIPTFKKFEEAFDKLSPRQKSLMPIRALYNIDAINPAKAFKSENIENNIDAVANVVLVARETYKTWIIDLNELQEEEEGEQGRDREEEFEPDDEMTDNLEHWISSSDSEIMISGGGRKKRRKRRKTKRKKTKRNKSKRKKTRKIKSKKK